MHCYILGLGSCAFARHYLRNHFCFLFLRVMRCFSSPGLPHARRGNDITIVGLPHSEIHVSMSICLYTWLIAAYHVLRRLREPRHPSCALLSFPFFFTLARFWAWVSSPCFELWVSSCMSSMFSIRFFASSFHRLCDFVLICSCSVFNYFLAFCPLRNLFRFS